MVITQGEKLKFSFSNTEKKEYTNNEWAYFQCSRYWVERWFDNGEKVEFDKAGEWIEVQCRQSEVPAQIVPDAIKNYVKTNYPDTKILQIERDQKEYEVKLSNRWEITFDSKMRVTDIDN